jgi:peptidoglycan/LPS O-acetylase OafA/YrhL
MRICRKVFQRRSILIDTLTSLRFIVILVIYFHHLNYPGGLGPAGVTFFFVLSGFIIAYGSDGRFLNLNTAELKSFYIKRLSRVYPLHILTFLISLPLMYITNSKTNLLSAALNIFLLQSFFPIGVQVFAFNALSWFLADIVFFYFLTPFLLFGLHKIRARGNFPLLLILLFFVFICETWLAYMVGNHIEPYSHGWWFIYISPWVRILDYNAGLLAGLIFVSIKTNSQSVTSRTLFSVLEIIAFAIFAGSVYFSRFVPYGSLIYSAYYVPFSIILIFTYSFQKGWISWLLSRSIFTYLGGLSFTFYMLHQLIISYAVVFFLSPLLSFAADLKHVIPQLLLLVNIIFLADGIFRYFETPVREKILSRTRI